MSEGIGNAKSDDGTAVVEFAVIFPAIALLIAGMIAFGLAYNAQLILQQAAREGVRVYALGSGDPVATAQAAASNLTGATVTTSGNCDPDDPGDPAPQASVTVSWTFAFDFAYSPIEDAGIPLSSRAVMRCGG